MHIPGIAHLVNAKGIEVQKKLGATPAWSSQKVQRDGYILLCLCSFSQACSYWISQIQSEKLCSARGRLKSSNPGLVQCISSLVSSLSAALEESTVRNYPIPAGGDSQPTEMMGSGDHCRGKRVAQLQELSQSEKRRCRRAPFAAQIRR